MRFNKTKIDGVVEFFKFPFSDQRGQFQRLLDFDLFEPYIDNEKIVHINHSITKEIGVVKGLHLQLPPCQEIKIIQALHGRVLDIALDLRKDSQTFLKYVTIELSASLGNGVILPKGVAHGFQVLEGDSELIYFHTAKYAKENEQGFNIMDPAFGIKLPLPIKYMSDRDKAFPHVENKFEGI